MVSLLDRRWSRAHGPDIIELALLIDYKLCEVGLSAEFLVSLRELVHTSYKTSSPCVSSGVRIFDYSRLIMTGS